MKRTAIRKRGCKKPQLDLDEQKPSLNNIKTEEIKLEDVKSDDIKCFHFSSNTPSTKNLHKLTHTSDKSSVSEEDFKCYKCHELIKYLSSSHAEKGQQKMIKCELCDFESQSFAIMVDHIELEHHSRDVMECEECAYLYTKPETIRLHHVVHTTASKKKYKDSCDETQNNYKCLECNFETPIVYGFNVHTHTHTKDKAYHCSYCKKWFYEFHQLINHLRENHPSQNCSIKCRQCDYTASNLKAMNGHKFIKHSVSKFQNCVVLKCTESECSFVYTKKESLQLHMTVHTQIKNSCIFKCSICDFTTKFCGRFNIHVRTHYADCPWCCHKCAKAYISSTMLKGHMKKCHPECIIECEKCAFIAYYPKMLMDHTNKEHLERVNVMSCEVCKTFIYTKPDSLDLHQTIHNSTPPYKCTKCTYTATAPSLFNCHILTHYKDRPYQCPFCNFCSSKPRTDHMERHHPGYVLSCEQCEFTTKSADEFQNHKKRLHTKPIQKTVQRCTECPFICTQSASLERHMVIHNSTGSTSRIFKCPDCKFSGYAPAYNGHIRSHFYDKPYFCPFCNIAFATEKWLFIHMSREHRDQHKQQTIAQYSKTGKRRQDHTTIKTRRNKFNVLKKPRTRRRNTIKHKADYTENSVYPESSGICESPDKHFSLRNLVTKDVEIPSEHVENTENIDISESPDNSEHLERNETRNIFERKSNNDLLIKCSQCQFLTYSVTKMCEHKHTFHRTDIVIPCLPPVSLIV